MDVEIWSDIACPWCYVGKRRFEAALAEFEHREEVRVVWRSFELDPDAPGERLGDRSERIAAKYGISVERARELQQQLTDAAAGEGLTFRFEISRGGSTFDAHRVVHLAREHGLQDATKERLLRAYLSEGELMSDHATLLRLAVESGVSEQAVSETLAGDRFADEVRADERTAAQLGISAVPTFVIDRSIGVSGAQSPQELLALLSRGWESHSGASVAAAAASSAGEG